MQFRVNPFNTFHNKTHPTHKTQLFWFCMFQAYESPEIARVTPEKSGSVSRLHSAAHHRTVQCSTAQYSTVQYSTVHDSTVQYRTVQYSTVQYSTAQYSTVHYSLVQYSEVQYSTVQYSTVQYSAVQCSTVQYSTVMYVPSPQHTLGWGGGNRNWQTKTLRYLIRWNTYKQCNYYIPKSNMTFCLET